MHARVSRRRKGARAFCASDRADRGIVAVELVSVDVRNAENVYEVVSQASFVEMYGSEAGEIPGLKTT